MQLKYFLECVEQRISQALAWNIDDSQYPQPQLAAAAEHLCKAQGAKRARPKLAYYFGISIDSDLDLLADVAVTAEFIHGASLLHDDVIDDGKIRRGNPTVNVVWDNLTAVLAGDLLLSESIKGLRRCPRVIAQEALDIVSEMTRATMLESHLRGSTSINKQQWIYIARGKTASMFRWCGRSAAFLGGSPEAAEHFRLFGDHFGIAFQMADDLLDVQYSGSGKTPFADIKNQNPSYPILLALERDPCFKQNLIDAWSQPILTEDDIVSLGAQVLATGAGHDTLLEVHAQVEHALNAIEPYLNRPGCSSIARWAQTLFERFSQMKAV